MRGGWEENKIKLGKETAEWEKKIVNCHESYGEDNEGPVSIFSSEISREKTRHCKAVF